MKKPDQKNYAQINLVNFKNMVERRTYKMIRIDYNSTINKANNLQRTANECQNLRSDIDSVVEKAKTCWQGSSATAFIDQCEKWKREATSIKSELNSVASDIKRIAREIREAELRAMEKMR